MKIVAIRAWHQRAERQELDVTDLSTVADIRLQLEWDEPLVSVFGDLANEQTVLQPGDRVEFLRPLTVDPKESRRQRAESKPLPRSHRKPRQRNAES